MNVKGDLNASEDVTANGISLTTHLHSGVKAGGDKTGGPEW